MENDGGPAFPRSIGYGTVMVAGDPKNLTVSPQGGMSLRDYFAGQLACGLLASCVSDDSVAAVMKAASASGRTVQEQIAVSAYLGADALLKERERANSPR